MPRSKTTTSKVRLRDSFVADVRSQVRWLRRQDRAEQVIGLREAVDEARVLLTTVPRAGALLEQDGEGELRKLVLRNLPFVIWYVVDATEVWCVRLFHIRQRRSLE